MTKLFRPRPKPRRRDTARERQKPLTLPAGEKRAMNDSTTSQDTQDSANGEFAFTKADFERVRKLIYGHAGISLHEGKQAMVYGRLSRRLRDTGHKRFVDYLNWLESSTGTQSASEWQAFVNCLTTNLTSFFREAHHFEALNTELQARKGQRLRLWCNAASTGEEPYSLAMTVADALGKKAPVQILCTDIDTNVLSQAEGGVYAADTRGLSPELLRRHFLRGMRDKAGYIRARPELQELLEFRLFNLMTPNWDSLGDAFDFVFCRNVMIYFDTPTQRKVLERIHARMKPRSLLFVGHSENFTDSRDLFELRGKTIYTRL
jgi:chemotaxis protein methyltransferase CheR